MAKKKKKRLAMEEDEYSISSSSSASASPSSSDGISRKKIARHRKTSSLSPKNTSKKERSYSHRKEIISFLIELKEEMHKQSELATESKEKVCKQLKKVREEMCQQSKQATEGKEQICKQLEKVNNDNQEVSKQLEKVREEMCQQSKQATEDTGEICKQLEEVKHDNQEMRKQLTEILIDLRKRWDLRTNGSSGDDSDAPRSQWNQVQPPRYRLVFKSGVAEKIEKGQIIDISVALVDGSSDQTVENGPLASATVELVVINAQFNQHNNQYNWSRQDFESNIIKKVQERNSATGDVDQSVNSIVSNGRFNLVQGFMCHRGSDIFSNSGNKKVRLGVTVVSPTEVRVLEGLSNPFFVRGHDRPNRQSNLRNNRSTTQRQALVENSYQEQISTTPNVQNRSWSNPIQAGGRTRQALVYNGYQLQNGQTPNLQNPLTPSSTQNGGFNHNVFSSPSGLNTSTRQLQLPDLSSGIIINEQQLASVGDTPMLSAEPSTSQDQPASKEHDHFPHLPMMPQATNYEIGMPYTMDLMWNGASIVGIFLISS